MKSDDQLKELANKTAQAFIEYLANLQHFKEVAGLKDVKNIHEICNSMTDKHGRICRHVKHMSRNDKKPEWPNEVLESIAGYLAYTLMLLNYYGDELWPHLRPCIVKELEKAIKQHSEKK